MFVIHSGDVGITADKEIARKYDDIMSHLFNISFGYIRFYVNCNV